MTLEEYYNQKKSQLEKINTEDDEIKQRTVDIIKSDSKILLESTSRTKNTLKNESSNVISMEEFFRQKGW